MSMRNTLGLLAAGMIPFLSACGGGGSEAPAPTAAPAAGAPVAKAGASGTGNGSVAGKISFEGTAPGPQKVKVSGDAKCAAMHKDGIEKQAIKVKDGGVAEVLVYVKSGISGTYPAPTEAAILDQQAFKYTPLVLADQANQPNTIRNSDDTLHNIHGQPADNAEFNIGQPGKKDDAIKLDKPELKIKVGCDVHPWMRSTIHVLSHPFFAVTKEDGTYEIKGLPAGEYEVEALHPTLPPVSQKVTVQDSPAKLDLTLKSEG